MTVLAEIAELVRQETGIALPVARKRAILAALDRAAPGLDPGAFVRAASGPRGDRDLVNRLIDEVTVQETAFLRDRNQLDAIDWHGLQPRRPRGRLGHHPGVERRVLDRGGTVHAGAAGRRGVRPGATAGRRAGNGHLRRRARLAPDGRYRERAVRALEPPLRRRYLDRQDDGSYLVGKGLRDLVRLRRHNLSRDPIPPPAESGFDLIICRNVLIYFEETLVGQVIASLQRSLRPDGELVLGAADARCGGPAAPAAARPGLGAGRAAPERPSRRPLRSAAAGAA